jgi:signal transduction histidine kinase
MRGSLSRLSLLWKIMLSTSIALTMLFALTAWLVQDQFARIASLSVEEEVRQGFDAYRSLWKARANQLASVCSVMSRMSDVRAAFGTADQATIRDTAGEIWSKVSDQDAFFTVTDPRGVVLARLGGSDGLPGRTISAVPQAASRFPEQTSGFLLEGGQLYQIVLTPVYVDSSSGAGLLNVLVAGYVVDSALANRLKQTTGGSEFVFVSKAVSGGASGGLVMASTLPPGAAGLPSDPSRELARVTIGGVHYLQFSTPLADEQSRPIGELHILRSFDIANRRIDMLRSRMIAVWILAVLIGLALTYLLAKRILRPVQVLDQAAAEIGRRNYAIRVEPKTEDELGRLSKTFNSMAESIQTAREDLIRQERISTIGRLSTSIVHDLRNPLAAIYGGAEMLIDNADLPPEQVRRLAQNIYRSSRHVQELLSELSDVTRGRTQTPEPCHLNEIVTAASEMLATQAKQSGVEIRSEIAPDVELPLERSRMERVFENLFNNAIEAMPAGGTIRITSQSGARDVTIAVEDTGPGIEQSIASRLFEPFVTAGKKNGIGLGLALSRKTVVDHGGDMWAESTSGRGARFLVRLPR